MECCFKGITNNAKELSSVDPQLYGDRMLDFIMLHTDSMTNDDNDE